MKKMMFNDKFGLTDAVLRGKKTQTRRIVPQSVIEKYSMLEDPTIIDDARYEVGEVVAVAQSYKDAGFRRGYYRDEDTLIPLFMGKDTKTDIPVATASWTNKMFVRADLMPHRIRITDVRVERLQDISDEDCIKEGIRKCYLFGSYFFTNRGTGYYFDTPRKAYASLIDKISGKGTWESNPYVFVYDFELVK